MRRWIHNFYTGFFICMLMGTALAKEKKTSPPAKEVSLKEIAKERKSQVRQWLKDLSRIKNPNKKPRQVVSLVSQILNYEPENLQALNILGVFYMERGQTHLARIIFSRGLKKYPKNAALHNNMGLSYLKEGREKEAQASFLKSLDYQPRHYSAAANLSALYMKAYEYQNALKYLKVAYRLSKKHLSLKDPQVVHLANNYAVALAWSGQFKKAQRVFQEVIDTPVKKTDVVLNYARLLARDIKNKNKALQILRKADLMDHRGVFSHQVQAVRKWMDKTSAKKNH